MKNLFNNISQEEKERILEMHSAKKNVISEQSTFPGQPIITQPRPQPRTVVGKPIQIPGQTPPNRPTVKPKPVTQPQIKKVAEGMTINLYDNSQELGQPQLSDKIVTIKRNFNQGVSLIMSTDVSINFKCGDNWVTENEIDKPSDENPKLYNKQLINSLTNQFCQSNKQGTTVPKADFAMNNQQDDTTTGVA